MGSGFKPLPVFAWGVAFLSFAAIAFTVHHLRINAAQPETQSELDASRGEQPSPEWPLLEIEKKNDAYYAQATGISYRKEHCGTQVEDAVLLAMSRTFADSVMVMLAHDGQLRRVAHAPQLPPAYLPADGGSIRDGDPVVLNPAMAGIVMRKRSSRLPQPTRRWIWSWIDYSGLLQLPASGGPDGTIDGSSLRVMVCRNGLHYQFNRSLNGSTPELPLQALMATLERHAPDTDDGQ